MGFPFPLGIPFPWSSLVQRDGSNAVQHRTIIHRDLGLNSEVSFVYTPIIVVFFPAFFLHSYFTR